MKEMAKNSAKLMVEPAKRVFFLPKKSARPPPTRLKIIEVTENSVKIIPTTAIGIERVSSK